MKFSENTYFFGQTISSVFCLFALFYGFNRLHHGDLIIGFLSLLCGIILFIIAILINIKWELNYPDNSPKDKGK